MRNHCIAATILQLICCLYVYTNLLYMLFIVADVVITFIILSDIRIGSIMSKDLFRWQQYLIRSHNMFVMALALYYDYIIMYIGISAIYMLGCYIEKNYIYVYTHYMFDLYGAMVRRIILAILYYYYA